MTNWEYGELIIQTEAMAGDGDEPVIDGQATFFGPDDAVEFEDERTVNVLNAIGAEGWEAVSHTQDKTRTMNPPRALLS